MNKCVYCGGSTARKLVTAQAKWGERMVLVEDTPAAVCTQCGEQYYDAETAQTLAELAKDPSAAVRTIAVPVLAYAHTKTGTEKHRRAS